MNPRISQAHNPSPMMPYPANLRQPTRIELLRQANEARNEVVVSGLQRLLSGFAGWIQRRRAETELMALTDRELADIGLNRSDIHAILRGGADVAPAPRAAASLPAAANDQFGKHAVA